MATATQRQLALMDAANDAEERIRTDDLPNDPTFPMPFTSEENDVDVIAYNKRMEKYRRADSGILLFNVLTGIIYLVAGAGALVFWLTGNGARSPVVRLYPKEVGGLVAFLLKETGLGVIVPVVAMAAFFWLSLRFLQMIDTRRIKNRSAYVIALSIERRDPLTYWMRVGGGVCVMLTLMAVMGVVEVTAVVGMVSLMGIYYMVGDVQESANATLTVAEMAHNRSMERKLSKSSMSKLRKPYCLRVIIFVVLFGACLYWYISAIHNDVAHDFTHVAMWLSWPFIFIELVLQWMQRSRSVQRSALFRVTDHVFMAKVYVILGLLQYLSFFWGVLLLTMGEETLP